VHVQAEQTMVREVFKQWTLYTYPAHIDR